VAADALQTHGEAAEFLATVQQAHYLFTSRPTSARCWTAAPAGIGCLCWTSTRDRGHGRVELPSLKAVSVAGVHLPPRRAGH
jgi:hypothetical protein